MHVQKVTVWNKKRKNDFLSPVGLYFIEIKKKQNYCKSTISIFLGLCILSLSELSNATGVQRRKENGTDFV